MILWKVNEATTLSLSDGMRRRNGDLFTLSFYLFWIDFTVEGP